MSEVAPATNSPLAILYEAMNQLEDPFVDDSEDARNGIAVAKSLEPLEAALKEAAKAADTIASLITQLEAALERAVKAEAERDRLRGALEPLAGIVSRFHPESAAANKLLDELRAKEESNA